MSLWFVVVVVGEEDRKGQDYMVMSCPVLAGSRRESRGRFAAGSFHPMSVRSSSRRLWNSITKSSEVVRHEY